MKLLAIPLLLSGMLLAADNKPTEEPKSKIPVSKETTHVTGPLDKNGYVNFEAALNEILAKGITPETNANAKLWQAFGPAPEGGSGLPDEYFKRLGIPRPPKDGAYFVGLYPFMKQRLKVEQVDPKVMDKLYDQQSLVRNTPWVAKDHKELAAWLKANEKPLTLVIEATKRPDYFNPLVSTPQANGEPGMLIGALLSSVQQSREIASALTARAMLRVGEGKLAEAWQDLLAVHRLARLLGRGATLIESLVSIAIHQIASDATLSFLEHADLTSKQIIAHLGEYRSLAALPSMADKVNVGERFFFLDSLQNIIRTGKDPLGVGGGIVLKPRPGMEGIDWEPAFRNGNKSYDRTTAAMRIEKRPEREKALDQIEAELHKLVKDQQGMKAIEQAVKDGKDPGKLVGKQIGDVLIGLLVPAFRKVQAAEDRARQFDRNLQVAFALAAYRKDAGRYPAKLADLAPKYLAVVPGDLFTDKELVYKPSEAGYLLYSFGLNQMDDDGRWTDDTPPGDDPRVRIPRPKPKAEK